MDWQRVIFVLVTLTFGLLFTGRQAFAQNEHGWPPPSGGPWAVADASSADSDQQPEGPPLTEMEREEQNVATGPGLPFVPALNENAPPPTAQKAVSIQQLQHPLSRKGRHLLDKVESYLRLGQRARAHQELAQAVKEPSAEPYAHAILGTEYLKDGYAAAAIPELESAARVLPISGVHSNLGYALCLTGQGRRGQQELEEALRLDGGSPQARFLLGVLLLNQKSKDHEAQYDLKVAQAHLRTAHLALAVCHLRRGELEAAQQEIREYLGPMYDAKVMAVWQWAAAAAADAHPAAAFGLREEASD